MNNFKEKITIQCSCNSFCLKGIFLVLLCCVACCIVGLSHVVNQDCLKLKEGISYFEKVIVYGVFDCLFSALCIGIIGSINLLLYLSLENFVELKEI